jgi:hypothetical protein
MGAGLELNLFDPVGFIFRQTSRLGSVLKPDSRHQIFETRSRIFIREVRVSDMLPGPFSLQDLKYRCLQTIGDG